jgi:pectin methylesterase-like acyl-CoA thioesterase
VGLLAVALIGAMMVITPASAAFEPGECDITVCASGCDYSSIQSAVNVASDGDTICVYNGTYIGSHNINKPNITLKGEGVDVVVLHGTEGVNIVEIGGGPSDAPGCIVEGFNFNATSSDLGVVVFSTAPNCIIRNTIFDSYIMRLRQVP